MTLIWLRCATWPQSQCGGEEWHSCPAVALQSMYSLLMVSSFNSTLSTVLTGIVSCYRTVPFSKVLVAWVLCRESSLNFLFCFISITLTCTAAAQTLAYVVLLATPPISAYADVALCSHYHWSFVLSVKTCWNKVCQLYGDHILYLYWAKLYSWAFLLSFLSSSSEFSQINCTFTKGKVNLMASVDW